MPPELVVADAPFKKYPGGIVAIRFSDWLGAARGSLSTESDAASVTGVIVRDNQRIANHIIDNATAAWNEAVETCVIDLAGMLESKIRYFALVSFKIEGSFDADFPDPMHLSTQHAPYPLYDIAFHASNNDNFATTSIFSHLSEKMSDVGQYRIYGLNRDIFPMDEPGDCVLTVKAYTLDGTNCNVLLDQLYLVPAIFGHSHPGWENSDFNIVGGEHGLASGVYSLVPGDPGWFADWIDGADGGDGNGKFTWHPISFQEQTSFSSGDGGGDYQKDDSEYMVKVHNEVDGSFADFLYLADADNNEKEAHCYGLHGPLYYRQQVFIDSPCSIDAGTPYSTIGSYGDPENTFVGDISPTIEGYTWKDYMPLSGPNTNWETGPIDFTAAPFGNHRHGAVLWCEDGALHFVSKNGGGLPDTTALSLGASLVSGGSSPASPGPGITAEDLIISGVITSLGLEAPLSGPYGVGATIYTRHDFGSGFHTLYELRLSIGGTGEWRLQGDNDTIHGPIAMTGFGDVGGEVGFKIEVKRYVLRVKVWDASGSEPGAWDYEDFRLIVDTPDPVDYDYDDNLEISTREADTIIPSISFFAGQHGTFGVAQVSLTEFRVEYDPYGDLAPAWASIEQPAEGGEEIGRIEMPTGCQHLVYWGKRDWTEYVEGDGPYIEFAAKVWNDPSAAELQRSEAVWWYFRNVHGGPIDLSRIRFRAFQNFDEDEEEEE